MPPRPLRLDDLSQEIPNRKVASCARQFRVSADFLHDRMGVHETVLPLLVVSSFGLELYLKSLNAESVYTQDEQLAALGGYLETARALARGHDLVPLFDAIRQDIRDAIEAAYLGFRFREDGASFREGLARYRHRFEDSRYIFEGRAQRDDGTITGGVHLLGFLGDWVDGWIVLLRRSGQP